MRSVSLLLITSHLYCNISSLSALPIKLYILFNCSIYEIIDNGIIKERAGLDVELLTAEYFKHSLRSCIPSQSFECEVSAANVGSVPRGNTSLEGGRFNG